MCPMCAALVQLPYPQPICLCFSDLSRCLPNLVHVRPVLPAVWPNLAWIGPELGRFRPSFDRVRLRDRMGPMDGWLRARERFHGRPWDTCVLGMRPLRMETPSVGSNRAPPAMVQSSLLCVCVCPRDSGLPCRRGCFRPTSLSPPVAAEDLEFVAPLKDRKGVVSFDPHVAAGEMVTGPKDGRAAAAALSRAPCLWHTGSASGQLSMCKLRCRR